MVYRFAAVVSENCTSAQRFKQLLHILPCRRILLAQEPHDERRRARHAGTATSSRSPAWTRWSSRWATRGRPRTTTRPRSACAAWPTAARRPAAGTRPPTCWSPARPGSCCAGRSGPAPNWRRHVAAHGDGVIDLAIGVPVGRGGLRVRDRPRGARPGRARRSPRTSTARSCWPPSPPTGTPRHTLVERADYAGPYLPGYVAGRAAGRRRPRPFFTEIDHCVGNVELGQMDEWVGFYQPGHGLHEHEGVRRRRHRHRVLRADEQGGRGRLAARSSSRSTSPRRARGSHRSTSTWSSTAARASSTSRWPPTTSWPRCAAMRAAGVEFLDTPDSYYDTLGEWVGRDPRAAGDLRELRSWPTGTRTGTCCRSSPSRCRTGRRCSSS